MNEIFEILPSTFSECVAREKEIQDLVRNLSSITPNNLSIVGPRNCGKTTLIKEVVNRIKSDNQGR